MLRMNHDPSLFEKLTKFEQCEEKIKDFSECSCCFENFTKMVFQCVRGNIKDTNVLDSSIKKMKYLNISLQGIWFALIVTIN